MENDCPVYKRLKAAQAAFEAASYKLKRAKELNELLTAVRSMALTFEPSSFDANTAERLVAFMQTAR